MGKSKMQEGLITSIIAVTNFLIILIYPTAGAILLGIFAYFGIRYLVKIITLYNKEHGNNSNHSDTNSNDS